jgi:hypothetical protein
MGTLLHSLSIRLAGSTKDVHEGASRNELCCQYWKAIDVPGKMCNKWV